MSRKSVLAVLVLVSISFIFLAGPVWAVKDWRKNEWAVMIEVDAGVHLCLYKLDDRADEFKPSSLSESAMKREAVATQELPKFFSQYYDSDYVYGSVYIDGNSRWVLTENTRIVLSYKDPRTGVVTEVVSQDFLFTYSTWGLDQKLFNPNDQIVVLRADSQLDRTRKTNGIIVLVRFPGRSLPRGSQFKWKSPDHAEVREVEGGKSLALSEGR